MVETVVYELYIHRKNAYPIYAGTYTKADVAYEMREKIQELNKEYFVSLDTTYVWGTTPTAITYFLEYDSEDCIHVSFHRVSDVSHRSVVQSGVSGYYEGYVVVPFKGDLSLLEQKAVQIFKQMVQEHKEQINA